MGNGGAVLGLGVSFQLFPTRVSMSVFWDWVVPSSPTATHAVREVHDTPLRSLDAVDGLGLGVTFQLSPLNISTSVRSLTSLVSVAQPTAMQDEMDMQDTELRSSTGKAADVRGLGVTRQVPLLKVSTRDVWEAL